MKKIYSLALAVLVLMGIGFTSAAVYNMPANDSSKIFFPIKEGKLTGSGYMKALNSASISGVSANATSATLTTTLGKKGTVKLNYNKNTYTITVGYVSCKVADYVSRKELPKTVTVDLTKVKCFNKKNLVNFLPDIKAGKRINVFFAKQNGTTSNTVIEIK